MLNFAGSRPVLAESGAVIGGVVFGLIVGAIVIVIAVSMWRDAESKGWGIFWIAFILLGIVAFFSLK